MKIVVDSGCDLSSEIIDDVSVAPLTLRLGEVDFVDDSSLNISEYIDCMQRYEGSPATCAPSPQSYLDSFTQGSGDVFAVTLSSKLSSSYQSAVIAKSMCEGFNIRVHVFDSLTASIGQTLVALKINEYISKNTMFNDIVECVTSFIKDMRTYIVLESYDNLEKNGRVSSSIAKFGALLGIRPICKADHGEIAMVERVRGSKRVLSRLVDIISTDKLNFAGRTLGISHVQCIEKACRLRDSIMQHVPFKDCIITEAGGLSTTYADVGGIVLAY